MGDIPAVIIDNGSALCKAGFATDDTPRSIIPSLVGHSRYHDRVFVGDEALALRGMLNIRPPVERGMIGNWYSMEAVWDHVFSKELHISPEEHPILITESSTNSKAIRERMTQTVFETFNAPAFYTSVQAVLSLYATGSTTGTVLESGGGVTNIVPIYEGFPISHAVGRMEMAGTDLMDYLIRMLMERGYPFTTSAERIIVRNIKERLCYVALDFEGEMETSIEKNYKLPDGEVITIGQETFQCPEAFFQPSLLGLEIEGIQNQLYNSIQCCNPRVRQDLYGNIILAGGSTMFPGMRERLTRELVKITPNDVKFRLTAPPERKYSAWIGGSILASLSTFRKLWISQDDYDESGPVVVHRKCF